MQSIRLERFGLEGLVLREGEPPTPGPGQVLVSVEAVSLNYRDLLMAKGHYDPKLQLPLVPCSDGAGKITGLGPGVSGWALGCLLYTSPSPRDKRQSRMPSSA